MIVPISDPADPRIADYLNVRERDLKGRAGLFMAEGEVVLRLLLARPEHRLASLLISEKSHRRLADALPALPAETPVYVAGQGVMDEVAGFPIHRGALALGEVPPPRDSVALLASLRPSAVVVGLLGLTNHDNVGGIFRNAAAFGADAVLLDEATCDPLYRKAIRVSVGASLIVPHARVPDAQVMLRILAQAGFETLALSPSGSVELSGLARRGRVAALFGTEGPGLPDDVMVRASTVRISMAPGFDSLNVATTSGIVLHHLTRERDRSGGSVPASTGT